MRERKMKKQEITLNPNDYIVFNGGLKIENISSDNCITLELPEEYTIKPLKIGHKEVLQAK